MASDVAADEPRDAAHLGPGRAQLVAWLLLAAGNAGVIALTLAAPQRPGVGALHHAYDLGQMVTAALAARAAIDVWKRWGAHGRRAALLALFGIAFVVDGLLLAEDLGPRAGKLAGTMPALGWLLLMTIATAATIPAAALLGRAMRRPLWRWLGVLAALQLGVANHLFVERNYPGVHLQIAWLSATWLGSCVDDLELVWPRVRYRRLMTASHLLACALAAWSLVTRPPSAVLVRLLARPGSVLSPFVARVHARLAAWFLAESYPSHDTDAQLAVSPSEPTLLAAPPIVVFVTVDCLRADLLEHEGTAARLPALRALRDDSVWFSQARTPAPASIVALASVFSGKYFSQLYWSRYKSDWQPFPHADGSVRLPQLLADAGVATATFHGCDWMTADTGVVGRFESHVLVAAVGDYRGRNFTRASRLVDAALQTLATHGEAPLFLFMHFLEAHAPYDLVDSKGDEFDRFMGELALVDTQIGRLRAALAAPELADRAALIVSADHGEAFGEHNSRFHGVTVYDELVRVPILIHAPGARPARIDTPVSLMDVGPTVLDLMGVVTPASFLGQSLVPFLRGQQPRLSRPVAIDGGRLVRAIVFDDGYKIIHNRRLGTVELYDLKSDPGEQNNLVDKLPGETAARLELLRSFFRPRELRHPGYTTPFRPP